MVNEPKSYKKSFKVKASEIDALNHVNNVVYLQWVNDISEKHWEVLSNEDLNKKYFWVVVRHEIDYVGQAFLDDKITVKTFIGESKGVKSIRHVEIFKGESLLVKVKSTWCLIDAKTFKPTRINEEVLSVLN
ncbi:acyl-CoA thioesterase [Urechidicola croceus]|uniref:Thioesterase n=1 Tax=Urechidicola croceus TaxID=1850246 RepID=A0A1D8P782_9FLAO|nr:thioesterase family protein [Urechidicola croceus]AOW20422.1 thioesterase [Urechidicola croceus]